MFSNDMSLDKIEGIEQVQQQGYKNNSIISNGHFQLNQMNFLPYYQIGKLGELDTDEFDVLDENKNFDYKKLKSYIQIQLVVLDRVKSKNEIYISEFRKCKEQDFKINGFKDEIDVQNLFCPDTDWLGHLYKVKNSYTNQTSRSSLSLEIVKCIDDC